MKNKITLIKLLLLIIVSLAAAIYSCLYQAILFSVIDAILIFMISNLVLKRYKKMGYIINSVLSFLFLVQQGVLLFSSEYITEVMFDNIDMIGYLEGMLPIYIICSIVLLLISLLPVKHIQSPFLKAKVVFLILVVYTGLICFVFYSTRVSYSPLMMFGKTCKNVISARISRYRFGISEADKELYFQEFYKDSISRSNVVVTNHIPQHPNIILLFAEGLSMEVLDVVNNMNLNLTPNLDDFYNKSMVFKNYYNHTAPTFWGIRGQLFSGFTYAFINEFGKDDKEKKEQRPRTRLISLVDILKANSYKTTFINVEPQSKTILDYFEHFYFDRILPDDASSKNLSDKQAFELLSEEAKKSQEANSPFFITLYNMGTHHGYDSPDIKYGDGKNQVLNRFCNFDAQFGEFFRNLSETDIFDNTILIVTTDHASYYSPEFKSIFKNTSGVFIDKVPLMFYWSGVKHEVIDAEGRNSIDFAPTVLDMMNISSPNYFLGESLFLDKKNIYNTTAAINEDFYYMGNGKVELIIKNREEIRWKISKYYSISYYYDD